MVGLRKLAVEPLFNGIDVNIVVSVVRIGRKNTSINRKLLKQIPRTIIFLCL